MDEAEKHAVVEALANVISKAHRKLRVGSKHPTMAGEPNSLAFAIARALVDEGVVQVSE